MDRPATCGTRDVKSGAGGNPDVKACQTVRSVLRSSRVDAIRVDLKWKLPRAARADRATRHHCLTPRQPPKSLACLQRIPPDTQPPVSHVVLLVLQSAEDSRPIVLNKNKAVNDKQVNCGNPL